MQVRTEMTSPRSGVMANGPRLPASVYVEQK